MTRSVVSCALESNRRTIAKAGRSQVLADILHPRAEFFGSVRVRLILSQKLPVRHEHRATAPGVRDYLNVRAFECLNILSRERARAFEVTGLSMQGAAADLTRGRLHRAAIHVEHTRRGLVDSLEKPVSHTSSKEKDRSARRRAHRSARIPGVPSGCFSIRWGGFRAVH